MRIIETDNFGSDYPNEKFVNLPFMSEEACKAVCKIVNNFCSPPGHDSDRYWKVVPNDYVLKPGFEP
jgi:hypothetical protein